MFDLKLPHCTLFWYLKGDLSCQWLWKKMQIKSICIWLFHDLLNSGLDIGTELVGVSNWCIFTVHQLDVASYFLLFRESFFPIRIYHLYWYLMDFLIDRFLSVYKKLQTIEIHFVKKSFKAKISNTKKFWLEKKTPNSIWLKKSSFFCLTTHTRIILKLPYESFGLQL